MRVCLTVLALVGCPQSKPSPPVGQVVVAVTVDWEGAEISPESLAALDELRAQAGGVPLTHFVSPAYLTKAGPDSHAAERLKGAIHDGDELALHLHGWRSLAVASKVEPRLSPSFVTGTDKLIEFEDGDIGLDLDLDAYTVPELRALIRGQRHLLEQTQRPVSRSFRAGGYLATPKVLQAIRDEGYLVDSSAIDYRQLAEPQYAFMARRVHELWPTVEVGSQPYLIEGMTPLIEMPIAATADYASVLQIVGILEASLDKLHHDPAHDVVVVLACNQETAPDFARRLGSALAQIRARPGATGEIAFVTVESAGQKARAALVH